MARWRAVVSSQCSTDVIAIPQVRPACWSVGICVSSDHDRQWLLVGVDAAHGLLHVLQHEFHRRNLPARAGAVPRSVFASTCSTFEHSPSLYMLSSDPHLCTHRFLRGTPASWTTINLCAFSLPRSGAFSWLILSTNTSTLCITPWPEEFSLPTLPPRPWLVRTLQLCRLTRRIRCPRTRWTRGYALQCVYVHSVCLCACVHMHSCVCICAHVSMYTRARILWTTWC